MIPIRTALVTGASRGLGRALALALAERGVNLALVARHRPPLDEVVAAIRRGSTEAVALPADVGDLDAATRLAGEATAAVGPLDLVVHNASALGPTPLRPLAEGDPADLEHVLRVNLVGPYALARATLGQMVLRDRGVQLFVSSDAAVAAYPTWGFYGASKAGLDHLVRILAAELDGTRVRAIAVDPGDMDTDLHRSAVPDADRSALADPADVARRILGLLDAAPEGTRFSAASFPPAAARVTP